MSDLLSNLLVLTFSEYKLMGFVSHMGPSSMVGHYVSHLWKENCWVLFNDSRVAASETLPKDLGYLYFYRRSSN